MYGASAIRILFLAANDVFRKKDKPFFAYIQTSGNHRPYNKSIPDTDIDFIESERSG